MTNKQFYTFYNSSKFQSFNILVKSRSSVKHSKADSTLKEASSMIKREGRPVITDFNPAMTEPTFRDLRNSNSPYNNRDNS